MAHLQMQLQFSLPISKKIRKKLDAINKTAKLKLETIEGLPKDIREDLEQSILKDQTVATLELLMPVLKKDSEEYREFLIHNLLKQGLEFVNSLIGDFVAGNTPETTATPEETPATETQQSANRTERTTRRPRGNGEPEQENKVETPTPVATEPQEEPEAENLTVKEAENITAPAQE
jgi:hypothetical protein